MLYKHLYSLYAKLYVWMSIVEKIRVLFGEALVGERPEVAHIDLIIGDKEEPTCIGLAFGLAHQSYGHTKFFAVLTPTS